MVDEALIRRLEGLAVNCDNTDGWNYAAEDIREAVRILSALATQEAEPGLIDEIHELAGMVGATFTPHEKPTPEAEPVAWASSKDWRKNQLMSAAQYNSALPKNRADFDIPLFTHPSPSITDAEVEAVLTAYQEQYDRGICEDEVRFALTAFLKARRQG